MTYNASLPITTTRATVNGLTLLLLLAMVVGMFVAWRAGVAQGRRGNAPAVPEPSPPATPAGSAGERSVASDDDALRLALADAHAMEYHATQFAEDRHRLLRELAAARAEQARYRDLCIDLENNAAPPLLDGPNAPDDLKLIVGIGPVLERMLHQMGISTYRQIARWSEHDVDEFDARLPEFPGRIRRDAWVTQARELHQSKFGETLPVRDR